MPKITSTEELIKLKKSVEPRLKIRDDADFSHYKSSAANLHPAVPRHGLHSCRRR